MDAAVLLSTQMVLSSLHPINMHSNNDSYDDAGKPLCEVAPTPNQLAEPLRWLIECASAYVYAHSVEERNHAFQDVSHALDRARAALPTPYRGNEHD